MYPAVFLQWLAKTKTNRSSWTKCVRTSSVIESPVSKRLMMTKTNKMKMSRIWRKKKNRMSKWSRKDKGWRRTTWTGHGHERSDIVIVGMTNKNRRNNRNKKMMRMSQEGEKWPRINTPYNTIQEETALTLTKTTNDPRVNWC